MAVPNSAIKSRGTRQYVQVFDAPLADATDNKGALSPISPREQEVEVGLSDDTNTEIIFGIKEGDSVVVQTIAPDAQQAEKTTFAPSIIPSGGVGL